LGYITRPCLKKKKERKKERRMERGPTSTREIHNYLKDDKVRAFSRQQQCDRQEQTEEVVRGYHPQANECTEGRTKNKPDVYDLDDKTVDNDIHPNEVQNGGCADRSCEGRQWVQFGHF
jgi:hypothetical protein